MRRLAALPRAALLLLWAAPAGATSAAGAANSGAANPDPPASACVEHVPAGKSRPAISERFPSKGKSGFVAWLQVTIEHGKGETILPGGFRLQESSDEGKALERAQFLFPDAQSPVAARLTSTPKADPANADGLSTTVSLPFIPLPKQPGRQTLQLPSVPIAVARASGEIITLCTSPHSIELEDPTANTPAAKPKHNLPGQRQIEEWTLLKHLTYGGLAALAAIALGFLIARLWQKRVRPAVPPPPPRPAWEVALEALGRISSERWIEQERYADHFDAVSDVVRSYLGSVYGYDGLESTTREALFQLERKLPPGEFLDELKAFLRKADLVKFARVTPTEAECHGALDQGHKFVRRTMPSSGRPVLPPSLPIKQSSEGHSPERPD